MLNRINKLLMMTQTETVTHLKDILSFAHKGEGYMIWSKTRSPKPMLCVHLDTINDVSNARLDKLELDDTLRVLSLASDSKAKCLGGDDRAGLYIALELITYMEETKDYKYDIGFFLDEEIGCLGSTNYLRHCSHNYDTTCYIGLDRRSPNGNQEIALYGFDNSKLTEIFEEYGYTPDMGSVTDASNLADEDTACINLSVGFDGEHTTKEVLYLSCMEETLNVLKEVNLGNTHYHGKDYFNYGYDGFYYDGYTTAEEEYIEELEARIEYLESRLSIYEEVHYD